MKDSEFLEILNLYLDHEISPADATRLETEVGSSPERYRTYLQYCRLHKGCTLAGDHAAVTSPSWNLEKSRAKEARRRAWSATLYTGSLAAACAMAVVIVRWHAPSAAPAAAVASAVRVASPAVAEVAPDRPALQAVFVARNLPALVTDVKAYEGSVSAALRRDMPYAPPSTPAIAAPQLNGQFAWMSRVDLPSVQESPIETAIFDPAPVLLDIDGRVNHPAQQSQVPVEQAAFQFQR